MKQYNPTDIGYAAYIGFAAMLADEYILIFLSLSAVVRARRSMFSFLLLTSTSVFNQQRFWAGHYKIPAQQQALAVSHFKETENKRFDLNIL